MKEFIVWYSNDINKDKFSKEFSLQELISQEHLDYISDSKILVNYKVDSINDGIGLKDINGKSIYDDSSIVEFEWGQDRHNIIGYFTFNQEYLSYEIIMLNTQKGKSMCYALHNCFNIKIIDTIQENKLGLIK